jgi:hypothetical protein
MGRKPRSGDSSLARGPFDPDWIGGDTSYARPTKTEVKTCFTTILDTVQKRVATLELVQCTCSRQVDGCLIGCHYFAVVSAWMRVCALTLTVSERYTY